MQHGVMYMPQEADSDKRARVGQEYGGELGQGASQTVAMFLDVTFRRYVVLTDV